MANHLSWQPSLDPTTQLYYVEQGRTINGPWGLYATVTASLSAALSGGNYNPTVGEFTFAANGPPDAWYRIVSVDVSGNTSAPSGPMMATVMPFFVPGSTPFGVYDFDPGFVGEADRMVDFVRKKLGEPVMTVHMSSTQIYAAFEEACLEYSAMVNSYQAKSTLASYLGSPTGSLTGGENKYVPKNLSFELYQADPFSGEADLNSVCAWYTSSFSTVVGQQLYDIATVLSGSPGLTGTYANSRVRVRDVYHRSPLQAYRFFGTTSGLNYLNNQFRFESFTPETLFYLLPVWEDILRGAQFKTSNNVRRSNYSFDLHNNQLRLFPTPADVRQIWLTYTIDQIPQQSYVSGSTVIDPPILPGYPGTVANMSNIPFGNIPFSRINSLSQHWIRRMTLALAKEIEGQIRSKFATVPIPNGDVTLNGPELIADARGEQEALRQEMRDLLEDTTYQSLMRKEQEMANYLNDALKNVPLSIYIGVGLLVFLPTYLLHGVL